MLESALKRDRVVVLASLVFVAGLAWVYLGRLATGMDGMAAMGAALGEVKPWGAGDVVLMTLMWIVMMTGMMIPSAAPMILTFATINRRKRETGSPYTPTAVFAAGYVIVWSGFAVAAALVQWGLQSAALLTPAMASASPFLGGAILIAAGAYQWTPLKQACLKNCRSPLDFVLQRWREGGRGALSMGLEHGAYCVGCCWVLMGLLFVGGVMNLLVVAAIAILVAAEKMAPRGAWAARASGAAMALAGIVVLLQ
jgi:predicted metal-binding membrane protein